MASSWIALSAPGGSPADVVYKLSVEANPILRKPELLERWRSVGAEPVGGTPADIQKFFVEERARWKRAVEVANLQKLP